MMWSLKRPFNERVKPAMVSSALQSPHLARSERQEEEPVHSFADGTCGPRLPRSRRRR